jgi:acyl carrier protein
MTIEDRGTDPAQVERWLTERVGDYLDRPAADVDPHTPLAELGMDSVYALGLCGDIEDAFGLDVDPTLAWDYPTVAAITTFLSGRLAAARAGGS